MAELQDPYEITTLEGLLSHYGAVNPNSLKKETDRLTAEYRAWIERAPFFACASIGAGGLDCSPRGDRNGDLFTILDDRTIAIPDRRGNNRLDTLRNIVEDPRVALLFLAPGINECVRINGTARITTDPALIDRFDMEGKKPATVIVVSIAAVYFQCARSLLRSGLWNPDSFLSKGDVPTAGQMTKGALPTFDADTYDRALPERQAKSLY